MILLIYGKRGIYKCYIKLRRRAKELTILYREMKYCTNGGKNANDNERVQQRYVLQNNDYEN